MAEDIFGPDIGTLKVMQPVVMSKYIIHTISKCDVKLSENNTWRRTCFELLELDQVQS